MLRLLFLTFLIVPVIEIGLFILLGQTIGLWPTLLGIVATALIGSAIIRAQGVSLLFEIRAATEAGQLPARQIADGMMLAIAGALLLTPGYFTDTMGFLLLVPQIRGFIYERLKAHVAVSAGFPGGAFTSYSRPDAPPRGGPDGDVVDLEPDQWRNDKGPGQG
ncbi:MAG: FxsA family protein [Hyphomicrobiaceae bacterium]|nr:FxsA family protein [Hyphomicrobiaceae bacterium]